MAQKGICGYVANTHQGLISTNLDNDNKYNTDVDDPMGNGTATDLLTVPILCKNELSDGGAS